MAFEFKDMYNKFARSNNKLNRSINKAIGKDVFKEVKEIEEPREFPPLEEFPNYDIPEPEQWSVKTGTVREFSFDGNIITVPANLDACIQYHDDFKVSAKYYAEQFEFKYKNCVQDFDALLHYFSDLYSEGLKAMVNRAYSVLLPFGIFNVSLEDFTRKHMETYRKAINSCEVMAGIEIKKNQVAEQSGNLIGNSIHMQGGGFGFKGAMKGVGKAEAFNIGLGALGKFVAHQRKMSTEDKEKAFNLFKHDMFFQEVYSDYENTFLTMVRTLSENNELEEIMTGTTAEYNTMIQNLQNPMFPKEKMGYVLVKLISTYPFETAGFELLQQKYGETEEVKQIVEYFIG